MPVRAILASTAFIAAMVSGAAHAQDRAAWFKSLKQPVTGLSCCDISDCRRTDADWKKGTWYATVRGLKRAIPPEKVLKGPMSIDGEAYVCAQNNPYIRPELVTIYCFVPPAMAM